MKALGTLLLLFLFAGCNVENKHDNVRRTPPPSGNDSAAADTGMKGDVSSEMSSGGWEPNPVDSVMLEISLWQGDGFHRTPPGNVVVEAPNGESWTADIAEKEGLRHRFGEFPVEQPFELVVYPDGKSGNRILIPVTMHSSMKPGLGRSVMMITIDDDNVAAVGEQVNGREFEAER